MSGHEDGQWTIVGEDGKVGIVREAKLSPVMDIRIYDELSVRVDYGKHGLVRVLRVTHGKSRVRHYWRRVRVPWIVWAMFR